LTNPGPFYERTLEFGNYYGIFHKGQLAAMAGQRMHAGPYIEISAVCTHPDYHGKGYATALIGQLIKLIRAQGGIPFLHVRADNNKAIALYRALGFLTRHEMTINILKKKG
jgi:predicted GNAT family acetyltransferase